jgi:hypothetical protein
MRNAVVIVNRSKLASFCVCQRYTTQQGTEEKEKPLMDANKRECDKREEEEEIDRRTRRLRREGE